MGTENWLPLTEYSSKYHVSISTLRRRIKLEKINFHFDDGKYFILDTPPEYQGGEAVTTQQMSRQNTQPEPQMNTQPVMETANRMLDELKKAYMLILQEKEEQLLQLKGEIADLRTLARVLETENTRLSDLLQKETGKSSDMPMPFY